MRREKQVLCQQAGFARLGSFARERVLPGKELWRTPSGPARLAARTRRRRSGIFYRGVKRTVQPVEQPRREARRVVRVKMSERPTALEARPWPAPRAVG